MTAFLIIVCLFSATFAMAFSMAWFLPLATARLGIPEEEKEPHKLLFLGPFLDLILILLDTIPIFWIFRSLQGAPASYRAARDYWDKENSVRSSFRTSIICISVAIASGYLLTCFPI